jgi:hypothetical protein
MLRMLELKSFLSLYEKRVGQNHIYEGIDVEIDFIYRLARDLITCSLVC